jgi:prophage regulatory protein
MFTRIDRVEIASMKVLSYEDLGAAKGIPFTRQWIHKLVKAGRFPKPVRLGENTTGFVESEIDSWIAARVRERDAATELEPAA